VLPSTRWLPSPSSPSTVRRLPSPSSPSTARQLPSPSCPIDGAAAVGRCWLSGGRHLGS
jgi:hypothetical protein